jgi:hypothetical protein
MGRLQPSARLNFDDLLHRMRVEYKDALISVKRREAFDRLVEAWSSEMGAISYAESLSLMDLLILTGEVDNRAFTEALKTKLDAIEAKLDKIESIHPS